MQSLFKSYKILSLIELFLLTIILGSFKIFLAKPNSNYYDVILFYIFFLIPICLGWKISSSTRRHLRVSETLIYCSYIFTSIKMLFVILLTAGGIYFFSGSARSITSFNNKAIIYYGVLFCMILFVITSLITFFALVAVAKNNRNRATLFD